jgi:DNA invertase Pin-like site-specific DNA recombinase
MGTVYGYLRVSTGKQDADNQHFAILSYANSKSISPVTFMEETVSGRVSSSDWIVLFKRRIWPKPHRRNQLYN